MASPLLKPLKGVDENLYGNLRTFFRLDYPEYEIILGARDAGDPALEVARRVAAEHPRIPCRIVSDVRDVGLNPKVNNLHHLCRNARHDVVLISDSNVAAPPDLLRDMVARLEEPGTGLVSSPIRGSGGAGFGGALERLQLNTFVMGGVAALDRLAGVPCVVGKSMLLRRSDLERFGGFPFLSRYLAEDHVCGEEIARLGLSVRMSPVPVDNVLGRTSLTEFARRHLRWGRMRWRICPAGYAAEILLLPVAIAIAGAVSCPSPFTLAVLLAALATGGILGAWSERSLGIRRPLLAYPLLEAGRSVLLMGLWAVPLFTNGVAWRGNRFRIGARTVLREVAPSARVPATGARSRTRRDTPRQLPRIRPDGWPVTRRDAAVPVSSRDAGGGTGEEED